MLALISLVLGCHADRPAVSRHTIEHDGVTREYLLYEPPSARGDRPLVVTLHGGGGHPRGHLGVGLLRSPHEVWLDRAEQEGFFVVAPKGLKSHWNDCRERCERCGDADDVGFLEAMLDEIVARHPIDADRIYLHGESNGGYMTQRMAFEAPDRFAAMGVTIALIPEPNDCRPLGRPVSIQYQVGTADALIPYEGGDVPGDPQLGNLSAAATAAYWVDVNQCAPSPATRELPDHDPDDGSTVTRDDYDCSATGTGLAVLHVRGAGHVASSRAVEVSAAWEALVGPQNHDLESVRSYWEFFEPRVRSR